MTPDDAETRQPIIECLCVHGIGVRGTEPRSSSPTTMSSCVSMTWPGIT
ncbi:hypothetical protein [Citricoccus muralis]|uniref:Uncharacterized protein n=1 Tax=Citricoccus muralis TaxID=169134 RepID=A0ABY8H3V7_9MICC|nr:hypothetical protein [Citricoccus muralis]WFP15818.1 hypothetical protein P8192_10475 [Citricoccus muralis]